MHARRLVALLLALWFAGCAMAPDAAPGNTSPTEAPAAPSLMDRVADAVGNLLPPPPCADRAVWRATLPVGDFTSSTTWREVLVDPARVYVLSHDSLSSNTSSITAVERATGAIAWNVAFRETQPRGWPNVFLVEGTLLFPTSVPGVSGADGPTIAVDAATGSELWRRDGWHRSLTVVQGVAILRLVGGVAALDPRTGSERWNWSLDAPGSTIGTLRTDGTRVLVEQWSPNLVVALDPHTGEMQWETETAQRFQAHGEGVIVTLGRDKIVALDATSGARLWERPAPPPPYPTFTAAGPLVVVADAGGAVRALDFRTGAEAWQVAVPPSTHFSGWEDKFEARPPQIQADARRVLLLSVNQTHQAPTLMGVPAKTRATLLDAADGRLSWERDAHGTTAIESMAGPIVLEARRTLVALDEDDGSRAWRCKVDEPVPPHTMRLEARAFAFDGDVFVAGPTWLLKLRA